MASKFHGTYEVTADFANELDYAVAYEVGDWLLVGHYNGVYYLPDEVVEVYGRDDNRKDALDYLRYCLRSDYYRNASYDYELWHVVDEPDWMPGVARDGVWGAPGERNACAPVRREDGRVFTFGSMDDARDYVLTALGDWSDDFYVDGIARDITRWLDGRLCLLAVDFWAVAAEHDLTHA